MFLAAEECNCQIAINSKEKALRNQESFQMLRFPAKKESVIYYNHFIWLYVDIVGVRAGSQ